MGDGAAGRVRQRGRRRRLRGGDPGATARPTAARACASASTSATWWSRATISMGDGVNVAARLEGLAEPGGIVVSGTAWDHLHGQPGLAFASLGEQRLKNIARPVRAYGWLRRRRSGGTGRRRRRERPVDRGAAVRQSERRPGAGLFQRRDHRGPDHRAVALSRPASCWRAIPPSRCAASPGRGRDRPPPRRALPARGQRAQGGRAGAGHRPADRRRQRRPSLGRPLRPRARRHLRGPGRGGGDDRGDADRPDRGGQPGAGAAQAHRPTSPPTTCVLQGMDRLAAYGAGRERGRARLFEARGRAATRTMRSAHAYLALAIFSQDWGTRPDASLERCLEHAAARGAARSAATAAAIASSAMALLLGARVRPGRAPLGAQPSR